MPETSRPISRKRQKSIKDTELSLLLKLRTGNSQLSLNNFSRKHTIEVQPNAAAEIFKQLGEAVHLKRQRKKPKIDPVELYSANITLEQVLHVAKVMTIAGKNASRTVAGMVKTIVGTV